jgi:Flp pilus assembly protein TadD
MLARCRLKLDIALTHARQAAQIQPNNPAILDTLAETHFQRGEKDKAITTIRQCIDLEPDNARHKAQLKRFEQSSPDSPPPA